MTQAIPRDQIERNLAQGIAGLRASVECFTYLETTPKSLHAIITNYRDAVIAEGLTAKHWPALVEIQRTYRRRCLEAGLVPLGFPL